MTATATATTTFNFPRRDRPYSISSRAAAHLLDAGSDRELVCRFAHWDGTFRSLLTVPEQIEIRKLADGFGRLVPGEPGYREMLWDWSHIRDSSDEAMGQMADWIRAWVGHYIVCSTCKGAKVVRPHPIALITVLCPECNPGAGRS